MKLPLLQPLTSSYLLLLIIHSAYHSSSLLSFFRTDQNSRRRSVTHHSHSPGTRGARERNPSRQPVCSAWVHFALRLVRHVCSYSSRRVSPDCGGPLESCAQSLQSFAYRTLGGKACLPQSKKEAKKEVNESHNQRLHYRSLLTSQC